MDIVPRSRSHEAPKQIAVFDPSLPAEPGREREFEEFYRSVRARAMAHAEYFIGYDAARDAVQKATIEASKRWDKMLPEERTAAWFLTKVHFRVVDELRRRRRYVELTEDVEERYDFPDVIGVAEATEARDLARWYGEMVAAMPLRRREVWKLVREQGFTYEQTASALGISVPTVVTHLQKARDYFLKGLKHAGVELTEGTIRRLLSAKTGDSNE
jgi:RNA polymerase sigma-70 factor (ECF subfamily)